jgi:hypothetical protein
VITSLPNNYLHGQFFLVTFDASHNRLTSFDVDFFRDCESLVNLILSNNRLSGIPPPLLAPLVSVAVLFVSCCRVYV